MTWRWATRSPARRRLPHGHRPWPQRRYTVDVSRETLDCTVGLDRSRAKLNLEKALRLADRLGGHLVTGHVDGVGDRAEVRARRRERTNSSSSAPQPNWPSIIARKGSVTVNGVSLTTNRVDGDRLLHQPDPAHRRSYDAQASATGEFGQS
jgi:riboflavin synthase alpha subunit